MRPGIGPSWSLSPPRASIDALTFCVRRSAIVRRNVARVFFRRSATWRRALVEAERRHALAKIVEEVALLAMPADPLVAYLEARTEIADLDLLRAALRSARPASAGRAGKLSQIEDLSRCPRAGEGGAPQGARGPRQPPR